MSEIAGKSPEKIFEVRHVERVYIDEDSEQEKEVEALHDINFDIYEGEFVAIIGSSGCGKTTLLRLMGGFDMPQEGELIFDGKKIDGPSPERGYVFQQGSLFPWWTVEQNIAAGLKARKVYRQNKGKVQEYINDMGLTGFEKAYPHQISGGMAQRVAIARVLINDPKVVLMDEPMGALDNFTRADIQDKLLEIRRKRNTTMVLVTHDIDEAIYLADRIVIMTPRPGKISEIIRVPFGQKRERGSDEFLDLRRKILDRFHLAQSEPKPEYYI